MHSLELYNVDIFSKHYFEVRRKACGIVLHSWLISWNQSRISMEDKNLRVFFFLAYLLLSIWSTKFQLPQPIEGFVTKCSKSDNISKFSLAKQKIN